MSSYEEKFATLFGCEPIVLDQEICFYQYKKTNEWGYCLELQSLMMEGWVSISLTPKKGKRSLYHLIIQNIDSLDVINDTLIITTYDKQKKYSMTCIPNFLLKISAL